MAVQVTAVGQDKFLVRLYHGSTPSASTEYVVEGQTGTIVTAAEALGAYRAVTSEGYYAQPEVNSLNNYAGVTLAAVTLGSETPLIKNGTIIDVGWAWTANAPIFISTDGVLTQTVSENPIRRIGWATSTTQINLDPFPTIGV